MRKEEILNSLQEKSPGKNTVTIIIFLTLLVILFFIALSFYVYFQTPEHKLSLGGSIEEAKISQDGKTSYIKLTGESSKNITKIKFIFKDAEGKEYAYETTEGTQEISVPFKRSFWDWLLGREKYEGIYDYEIKAEEINLDNFNNMDEVSVLFEYKTETGDINETGIITSTNITRILICNDKIKNGDETGIDCGGSCKACSQGGGGGGYGHTPCNPNKDCSYYYNLGQCGSSLNDGCSDSLNCLNCSSGETCINDFCIEIAKNCTSNENCFYLDVCGYGICNASNKCEIAYNVSGTICNDGLFCTENDVCNGVGNCQGTAKDCSDAISCTDDNCNEINDECNNVINNSNCNYPQETCNETQGCIANLCMGLTSCSDYTDAFNCTNDPCRISGGCEWNTTINDCEPAGVNMTSSISQYNITWTFDKEYEYGTFANGDYWVVGPVIILNITPEFFYDGHYHNGWMVNMAGEESAYDSRVGFNTSLIPSLPYIAKPGDAIIKSISFDPSSSSCRPCLKTTAVLTVLDSVPENNGATLFRPPFFGNERTFYSINQINYSKLTSIAPPVGYEPDKFSWITNRFKMMQLDVDSYPGENIRAVDNFCSGQISPSCSYGGSLALDTGDAALRFMLNDSIENKKQDLIYYMQMGIDLYHIMKNGMDWESNGGHGSGRKLPIILTAILLENQTMKDAVKNARYNTFQEDGHLYFSQIANNGKGEVLFGDPASYWLNQVSDEGSRTAKDPYNYIDGGHIPGTSYQSGINSMIWKGPVVAMTLMPEIKEIWNMTYTERFIRYTDRWVYLGSWAQPDPCAPVIGICKGGPKEGEKCSYAYLDSSEKNTFCYPGHCAGGVCSRNATYAGMPCSYGVGPAPNASGGYRPEGYGYSCGNGARCDINMSNYGVYYGSDPLNSSKCILDTNASDGIGRHPFEHGKRNNTGGYHSSFVDNMWVTYRKIYGCIWVYDNMNNGHYDCSNCSYNCLQSPYCGDGSCNGDETSESCVWDCGEIGGASSLSPLARIWNWIKGLLTAKTGKAILTGKTITGNVVSENLDKEKDENFFEKIIKLFKKVFWFWLFLINNKFY